MQFWPGILPLPELRLLVALLFCSAGVAAAEPPPSSVQSRVCLSADGHSLVLAGSGQPFQPWGFNYGHDGKLLEDFWVEDWATVERDFHKMKEMGANVARVHLQYGRFMEAPDRPREAALRQLAKLLHLAEEVGIYLDLTGLGAYRPADGPAWYDALDEPARWSAQSAFWSAIAQTCQASPAVFCYDLINEPFVPGSQREPGQWRSGKPFGGYDFVQFIALAPAGRKREDIAVEWVRKMVAAIHAQDRDHLITIGLLPWSRQWGDLSGFVPPRLAPELDFLSVHLYPDAKLPGEALEALQHCAVGKPVVIEETFPLSCSSAEWETFLRQSRPPASGWIAHFDGQTPDDLDAREQAHSLTLPQAISRDALRTFRKLQSELEPP